MFDITEEELNATINAEKNSISTQECLKQILIADYNTPIKFPVKDYFAAITLGNRIRVTLSRVKKRMRDNNLSPKYFKLMQSAEVINNPETNREDIFLVFTKIIPSAYANRESLKKEFEALLAENEQEQEND